MRLAQSVWLCLCISPILALPEIFAQKTNPPTATPVLDLSQFQPTEDALFQEAMGFVQSKNPARAITLFLDCLRYYPQGRFTDEALYRVAVCYRDLGRFPDARETLNLLTKKFPNSSWKEPGLLLAGEMFGAEKKWNDALPLFKKASASTLPELSQRAHYLAILSADNLKDLSLAQDNITSLLKLGPNGSSWSYANLKEATRRSQAGKTSEALPFLKQALESTKDDGLKAEAAVRAGNFLLESKNVRESIGYFEIVRKTAAPDFWKKLAHFGLVQAYFALPDYPATIAVFNEVRPAFPDQVRPQTFFLVAEAYRLTDQTTQALPLYDFILKEFPQDPLAEPSLWARILMLQKAGGKKFLAETARYLSLYPATPRTYTVQLLRAETTYETGDYLAAVPMLDVLLKNGSALQQLKPEAQASLFFRRAHSAYVLRDHPAAISHFTKVADRFPQSSMVASALWLKGQSELSLGQSPAALQSWTQLIQSAPLFEQRSEALWQSAQLAGSLKKYPEMQRFLNLFIQEFPQEKRLAEAHALLALAYQELGNTQLCAASWAKARKLDEPRYFVEATQQLIRLALEKSDLKTLQKEVEAYDLWKERRPQVPSMALAVYEWLGQELMLTSDAGLAEPYLRRVLAASKDSPQRKRVQLRLAMLMSQLNNHGGAVREWQIYRVNFPEESNRSPVLEPLAQAQIGAGNFEAAKSLAEQILKQNPEGDYNAKGRLLLGEVEFGKRNYKEAAKIFNAVSVLIDDPTLTPLAQTRAEAAYRLAGDTKKADELQQRLPQLKN